MCSMSSVSAEPVSHVEVRGTGWRTKRSTRSPQMHGHKIHERVSAILGAYKIREVGWGNHMPGACLFEWGFFQFISASEILGLEC